MPSLILILNFRFPMSLISYIKPAKINKKSSVKISHLKFFIFLVHLNAKTDYKQNNKKKSVSASEQTNIFSMDNRDILGIPARTAVPTQESTPDKKELNGKDPTTAM